MPFAVSLASQFCGGTSVGGIPGASLNSAGSLGSVTPMGETRARKVWSEPSRRDPSLCQWSRVLEAPLLAGFRENVGPPGKRWGGREGLTYSDFDAWTHCASACQLRSASAGLASSPNCAFCMSSRLASCQSLKDAVPPGARASCLCSPWKLDDPAHLSSSPQVQPH